MKVKEARQKALEKKRREIEQAKIDKMKKYWKKMERDERDERDEREETKAN